MEATSGKLLGSRAALGCGVIERKLGVCSAQAPKKRLTRVYELCSVKTLLPQRAFTVHATSAQWAVKLDALTHDPSDAQIQSREVELRTAGRNASHMSLPRAREFLSPLRLDCEREMVSLSNAG
ncbi:MAG TPA: hypothetical protein VJR89_07010 [Polyangiales bacterium]|nr:hypothetical protein [Polyangiales bacterium]